MNKKLRLFSLTSLLVTGVATASLAANTDTPTGSQPMTSRGSPQTNAPATGAPGAYGMNNNRTGSAYPSVVGPTGSTQPDATNPNRSAPSHEGTSSGSNSGGGSGAGGSSR
jgi:hypothetical protein